MPVNGASSVVSEAQSPQITKYAGQSRFSLPPFSGGKEELAILVVNMTEGAILVSKVMQSTQPLRFV